MTCDQNNDITLEAVVTSVKVVGWIINVEAEVTLIVPCMQLKRQ